MIRRSLLACLAAGLLITGCATTPAPAPLADTLGREPQLGTFNRLVAQAGLGDELRATGPMTVFAPSDEAFKALPAKTMEALAADRAQLRAVLNNHIVEGRLASSDVKPGAAKTRQGGTLALATAGSFVTVDDAIVQQPDLVATNGVAHVVDRVLLPKK
ncbi:fasciclin domain-containing protein [Roseateles cellulosilyticus]|uniref:Fasciclin domain-containing protein n=1 Tax=Pelomonas cellulosilytica TaxID=2906762 RepID=A0ABS8Y0G0_9BURK|nr:fasciclin domain-containing protein [Pelomonas sp. P8]MCE4557738.1 fasciclin domain-containing protein [Pelomonas sp. P8]